MKFGKKIDFIQTVIKMYHINITHFTIEMILEASIIADDSNEISAKELYDRLQSIAKKHS